MIKYFWDWLDREVDNNNEWVKEDERIRFFFSIDTIFDRFVSGADVAEEQIEEDDYSVLKPIWDDWAKTAKPFEYTQKDIDDHIKEHKAEMRIRAMESGYHNFVDDGERTYYW